MRFILNTLMLFFIIQLGKYLAAYIGQETVQYTLPGVSIHIAFSLVFAGVMEYRRRSPNNSQE
jgi:uncharacterized membrane protein YfcA